MWKNVDSLLQYYSDQKISESEMVTLKLLFIESIVNKQKLIQLEEVKEGRFHPSSCMYEQIDGCIMRNFLVTFNRKFFFYKYFFLLSHLFFFNFNGTELIAHIIIYSFAWKTSLKSFIYNDVRQMNEYIFINKENLYLILLFKMLYKIISGRY